MKFHEKLCTLRKAAHMTQIDLAEKLDVSRQAVSRWEMGTAMPDVDNLIAISELFSVTLDDLLKDKERHPESQQENKIEADDPKDPPVIHWMRCAMILICGGISQAFGAAMFGTPFATVVMILGFVMLGIGCLIGVVLFIMYLIHKKRE